LAACIFLQQWNVIDSMKTYGSPEYSVIHPEEIGRDRLEISSVSLLADRRTLFVAAPAILPTPGAHRLMLIGSDGRLQDQVLFTVR